MGWLQVPRTSIDLSFHYKRCTSVVIVSLPRHAVLVLATPNVGALRTRILFCPLRNETFIVSKSKLQTDRSVLYAHKTRVLSAHQSIGLCAHRIGLSGQDGFRECVPNSRHLLYRRMLVTTITRNIVVDSAATLSPLSFKLNTHQASDNRRELMCNNR